MVYASEHTRRLVLRMGLLCVALAIALGLLLATVAERALRTHPTGTSQPGRELWHEVGYETTRVV